MLALSRVELDLERAEAPLGLDDAPLLLLLEPLLRAPAVGLGLPHLVLEARVAVPEEGGGEGERGARVAADHERPHDLAGVVVRADDRRDDRRDEREDQQLQRPRAVQARVPVPRGVSLVRRCHAAPSLAAASTQRILSGATAYAATRPGPCRRRESASSIASSGRLRAARGPLGREALVAEARLAPAG